MTRRKDTFRRSGNPIQSLLLFLSGLLAQKSLLYFLMINFLLKKTFFDLWDNAFKIILINLGFLASFSFSVFIPPLLTEIPVLRTSAMIIGILWCTVYLSAAALSLKSISDHGSFGFTDFFQNLGAVWPAGLALGALFFLGFVLLAMVIPFYLGMGSMIGLLLGAVVFWTLIVAVLALQFFLAVRARLDFKIIKVIKKCFLLFFDNPAFCLFSLFHNLFVLILSILLAFLFPGPAGLLLFLDEGLRLRLMKYDWLEAKTNEDGKIYKNKIPWDDLLAEERERTGNRSFKNLLFPWKD